MNIQISWEVSEFIGEAITAGLITSVWGAVRFRSFRIRRQMGELLDKVPLSNSDIFDLAKKEKLFSAEKELKRFLNKKYGP